MRPVLFPILSFKPRRVPISATVLGLLLHLLLGMEEEKQVVYMVQVIKNSQGDQRGTMTSRELPELRFARKCQLRERELKRKAREQDRKSNVVQRQMDRHIYLATQELHDIQTRTLSPSLSAGLPPRITVWEADHNDDLYDVERRRTAAAITTTTTTVRNGCSDLTAGHLVHLRARTRRNLLVSQKLSHSLERLDERRAHSSRPGLSPRDFSSAGTDTAGGNAALRPVSSRSMEELQRAASVLRFTEHEQHVQELLSSVSLKDKR